VGKRKGRRDRDGPFISPKAAHYLVRAFRFAGALRFAGVLARAARGRGALLRLLCHLAAPRLLAAFHEGLCGEV
jgi:hypothetical protein